MSIIDSVEKKSGIEKDWNYLKDILINRFNELKNLVRENQCCKEFIKDRKLSEEYEKYRIEFYQQRKWKG